MPGYFKTLKLLTVIPAAALMLSVWAWQPASAQGLRPAVGKPLQEASELLKAGKAREALAKVREAEAVGGKSAAEQLTVDRMKAAAAQRAGDHNTAIQALEAIYSKVGGSEKGQVAEQLASAFAQQRNNAKAGEWLDKAIAAGNNSGSVRQMQSYLLGVSGDWGAISREAAASVAADEKAGRRPDEGDLLRLADAQSRTNNTAGQINTLEKLVAHYPKKDYWNAYLGRLVRKPGFSNRLTVDVLRLRLATDTLASTEDYMELAQLSLQDGLPAEALKVIDLGTKAGVLGTGPEAARHQRLRDLATKQLAEVRGSLAGQAADAAGFKDGDALIKVGYAHVSLGEVDKGIGLIQQGINKGQLKHPEDAKLRLGMAQLQSPKLKNAGLQTLRGIKSNDGAADVARVWTLIGRN